jgi:hypothetical protein
MKAVGERSVPYQVSISHHSYPTFSSSLPQGFFSRAIKLGSSIHLVPTKKKCRKKERNREKYIKRKRKRDKSRRKKKGRKRGRDRGKEGGRKKKFKHD